METNDIKKYLYKNKPNAFIQTPFIKDGKLFKVYRAFVGKKVVEFNIPDEEAVNFSNNEPAQLLIRWLI